MIGKMNRRWLVLVPLGALGVLGVLGLNCTGKRGFHLQVAPGTELGLKTTTESTVKMTGLMTEESEMKTTLDQRLVFSEVKGNQRVVKLITRTATVDDGGGTFDAKKANEALSNTQVNLVIDDRGRTVSMDVPGLDQMPAAAKAIVSSQTSTMTSIGPMGYVLPERAPEVGQKWMVPLDLTQALREASQSYLTPESSTVEYEFEFLGEETINGRKAYRIRRIGSGTIKNRVNIKGLAQEGESKLSSKGELLVDAASGLLIRLEADHTIDIDLGIVKIKQSGHTQVLGTGPQ